ncbi:MAG: helix-turn-helix transcriptional regulator [Thermonemataceae bacterium]
MANKNQLLRYLIIDEMLRNRQRKYPSKQDIIETITERTDRDYSDSSLEKDLRAMRTHFNAPIEFHNGRRGYFYGWKEKNRLGDMLYEEDKDYRFMSISLSKKDVIALNLAESVLEGFKGMGLLEGFSDAVDKVLDVVEIGKQLDDGEKSKKSVIQFDTPSYVKGRELLAMLVKAIQEQKQVSFEYQKFNSEERSVRKVHPYLLKEFKGRWYLVCYEDDMIKNFGLDRMANVTLLEKSAIPPEKVGFNAAEHFKYCYGIAKLSETPDKIILSFSRFYANYIKTQPIHPTQKELISNEEEYRISLEIIINPELISLLLSFGPSLKVISPQKLVDLMKEELEKTLNMY